VERILLLFRHERVFVLLCACSIDCSCCCCSIFILPDVEDAAISASAFVTAFSATIFSDGSSSTDTFVGVVCDNSIGLQ
jgi:hypothetical protein